MAEINVGRVAGSRWHTGDKITGSETTPTVFPTGIEYALKDDLYLNKDTRSIYQCASGGDESTATWIYVTNVPGGYIAYPEAEIDFETGHLNMVGGQGVNFYISDGHLYAEVE